jgi:hypothetical protein
VIQDILGVCLLLLAYKTTQFSLSNFRLAAQSIIGNVSRIQMANSNPLAFAIFYILMGQAELCASLKASHLGING